MPFSFMYNKTFHCILCNSFSCEIDVFRLDYSGGKIAGFLLLFFSQRSRLQIISLDYIYKKYRFCLLYFIDLTPKNCLFSVAESFVSVKITVWLGQNEVLAFQSPFTSELHFLNLCLGKKMLSLSEHYQVLFHIAPLFPLLFLYFLLVFLMQ